MNSYCQIGVIPRLRNENDQQHVCSKTKTPDYRQTYKEHTAALCSIVMSVPCECPGLPYGPPKKGLPCAPWCCTIPFTGAQCNLMIHKVVLYRYAGAQCNSHKPRRTYGQTDRLMLPNILLPCFPCGIHC